MFSNVSKFFNQAKVYNVSLSLCLSFRICSSFPLYPSFSLCLSFPLCSGLPLCPSFPLCSSFPLCLSFLLCLSFPNCPSFPPCQSFPLGLSWQNDCLAHKWFCYSLELFPSKWINLATRAFGDSSPSKNQWYTPLVEVNHLLGHFRQILCSGFVSTMYSLLTINSELSKIQEKYNNLFDGSVAPNLSQLHLTQASCSLSV